MTNQGLCLRFSQLMAVDVSIEGRDSVCIQDYVRDVSIFHSYCLCVFVYVYVCVCVCVCVCLCVLGWVMSLCC